MQQIGVAVIPAKRNSIAIPNKNMQTVGGRSLLHSAIDQAQKAEMINQIFVVTEDNEIADRAEELGATPFPCTEKDSHNSTMVWEKVRLVAKTFTECQGGIDPCFVELHTTYPFRTPDLIDKAVSFWLGGSNFEGLLVASPIYDRVWRHAPLILNQPHYKRVAPDLPIASRQNQQPLYIDHYGLCNVFSHGLALKGNPYEGKLTLYFAYDKRQTLDIDDKEDLEMCRSIARGFNHGGLMGDRGLL